VTRRSLFKMLPLLGAAPVVAKALDVSPLEAPARYLNSTPGSLPYIQVVTGLDTVTWTVTVESDGTNNGGYVEPTWSLTPCPTAPRNPALTQAAPI